LAVLRLIGKAIVPANQVQHQSFSGYQDTPGEQFPNLEKFGEMKLNVINDTNQRFNQSF
jgi:hypothetical protein